MCLYTCVLKRLRYCPQGSEFIYMCYIHVFMYVCYIHVFIYVRYIYVYMHVLYTCALKPISFCGCGFETSRSPWSRDLRPRLVAVHLLGLRVRIPPEVLMFVLCRLYSKDKRQKPGQSRQRDKQK
jgi:hypothetical protein